MYQSVIMKEKIIIVGGGVIGTLIAYYLSKYNENEIIIIEKSSIACAASGKAGGFLAKNWCEYSKPLSELSEKSFELHEELSQIIEEEYGYRKLNAINLLVKEENLNKKEKIENEITPEWITINYEEISQIGDTNTTAQLNPKTFTKSIINKIKNIEIIIDTVIGLEIENINKEEDEYKIKGVKLMNQTIYSNKIILAMGPWSNEISEWFE
jgi:glycine/D-amino acid oxidase-like deaminating enzyme